MTENEFIEYCKSVSISPTDDYILGAFEHYEATTWDEKAEVVEGIVEELNHQAWIEEQEKQRWNQLAQEWHEKGWM